MKEIDMNNRNISFRTAFERIFAGLVFGSAAFLVLGGTIAACLQNAPLGA
jgi:hypothetical protein